MKAVRRDWNHFWFGPLSSVPLGLFRLVFGALVLAYGLLLFPDRFLWFSDRGLLTTADANILRGVKPDARWLNVLEWPGAEHGLTLFFVVFLLAALSLTLGWWTRASSIVVYLGICALHGRDTVIHNSGDTVMQVMSAYLVLAPAGAACSLDRLRRILRGEEDDEPPLIIPWAQRLMQIQVALIYLCASLSKAGGQPWMDGTAAYYPLHLPESVRFPMPGQNDPLVINAITWGTVLVEFSLATFVWVPRLRLYVIAAGVALHLGIEYTLNIPLFSFLMIASYVTFLTGDDLRHFLAWAKRPLALTPLRLVYDGECDFCKSVLLMVRFCDVFRQITFIDSHDPAALAATGVRFAEAEEAAIAVRPDGRQFAGFDAFRQMAWQLPATALFAPLLYLPPLPQLGRWVYAWVKDNRARLPVAPRYKPEPDKARVPLEV